jgi:hypothetical protein
VHTLLREDIFAGFLQNELKWTARRRHRPGALADRLPPAERTANWELAYTAYQRLWTLQGAMIDKLPLHHQGEVLAGLAQTAQRTGRDAEASQQIERILTLVPDTAYAARALEWKNNPAARSTSRLTCQTCHAPGTLAARVADVSKQP